MPAEDALPVLPGTVSAAHLRASAAALADATAAGRVTAAVADAGELAEVLTELTEAQRHLSRALARLGSHLRDRSADAPPAGDTPDLAALAGVLAAASSAAGYTADALAEGAPVVEHLCEISGRDTRL